jgi:chemotaxis protein methyltransferase CheR
MTLDPGAFAYVSSLVRRESAIVLEPGKEYLVESRLMPLARAAGLPDVDAFVARLRSAPDRVTVKAVVEALTTNETSWFRDGAPFEAFRKVVVPELLETPPQRRINIWSAACSSGQEAYTIAMLLAEDVLPRGRNAEILATDISTEMLDRTREASYGQLEIGRGLPAPMLVRHFQRSGTQWRVNDQLRAMVRVQQLNLADRWPYLPVFDVVFLRNVLIYFDTATKRSILQRVRQVLSPQGFLFLGGAETTLGIDDGWTRSTVGGFTLYRPIAGGTHGTTPTLSPSLATSTGR